MGNSRKSLDAAWCSLIGYQAPKLLLFATFEFQGNRPLLILGILWKPPTSNSRKSGDAVWCSLIGHQAPKLLHCM